MKKFDLSLKMCLPYHSLITYFSKILDEQWYHSDYMLQSIECMWDGHHSSSLESSVITHETTAYKQLQILALE